MCTLLQCIRGIHSREILIRIRSCTACVCTVMGSLFLPMRCVLRIICVVALVCDVNFIMCWHKKLMWEWRLRACLCMMSMVGQNRTYTPYMTVYLMISLPEIPYIHRIYMVLANPNDESAAQRYWCDLQIVRHTRTNAYKRTHTPFCPAAVE
jgi:hypothetical protein